MAIVYKITNRFTNKCYIGYTTYSFEHRICHHFKSAEKGRDNRKFYNAIRKYRNRCCWSFDILESDLTIAEAKMSEIKNISLYDSYSNGYNSTKGGDGNNGIIMSKESNEKRSKALKGIPKTYKRMKDKFHTELTKEKISASHKGKKKPWVKWDKDTIVKRAMTRRTITEEQHTEILKLRTEGVSIREISKKINLSIHMVKKWSQREWNL